MNAPTSTSLIVTLFGISMSFSAVGCTNKAPLKQELERASQAIVNYRKTYGVYPPIYVLDDQGAPAHSWRVLVLPFISANSFTEEYDFDAHWDSAENLNLLVPETTGEGELDLKDSAFAGESFTQSEDPKQVFTSIFVVANRHVRKFDFEKGHSALAGKGRKAYGFESGPILVIGLESSNVHWMKPTDLAVTKGILPDAVLVQSISEKIVGSVEISSNLVYRNREKTLRLLKEWVKAASKVQ